MERGLPQDFVMEILLRLPAKTLLRFKAVSKVWSSFISSNEFVKWHLNQQLVVSKHRIILPRRGNNLISLHCDESGNFHDLSASQFVQTPSFVSRYSTLVGHCNGVLCISTDSFKTFHLWNPSIMDYRKMPSLWLDGQSFVTKYGFGYDTETDDYKIVVAVTRRNGESVFKIFSLRHDTWKSFPDTSMVRCWFSGASCRAVYLNGALYWVGKKSDKTNSDNRLFILSFNLSDETLKEILVPDSEYGHYPSLGVIDGYLFFTASFLNSQLNGSRSWMMHQYELDLSSIKLSYVSRNCAHDLFGSYPLCFTTQCDIVFGLQRECFRRGLSFDLVIWNNRTNTVRRFKLGTGIKPTEYLETLVSPNAFCKNKNEAKKPKTHKRKGCHST